jgi:hypothetical protein
MGKGGEVEHRQGDLGEALTVDQPLVYSTPVAGQSRQVSGFIDEEQIIGVVEEFPYEFLRLKFELDFVIAQDPSIAIANRHLVRRTQR